MRNSNSTETSAPISAVPVSLYREICGELRDKSGQVETLQLNNQRILQENQQLRQELQRLVQMVMHTHHQVSQISEFPTESTANGTETFRSSGMKRSTAAVPLTDPSTTLNRTQMPARTAIAASTMVPFSTTTNKPEDWITGTQEPLAQRLFNKTSAITQDLAGWKLALVISLIILSAFGAGFLIVRPLISQPHPQQNSKP